MQPKPTRRLLAITSLHDHNGNQKHCTNKQVAAMKSTAVQSRQSERDYECFSVLKATLM